MNTQTKSYEVPVGNKVVRLLPEGDVIVRMLRNGKAWEPETRAQWGSLVTPLDIVVDVGAYTGVYSIASALMGCKVMAIEPHPINYRRLINNAALNDVSIEAWRLAASDEDTTRILCSQKPPGELNDIAALRAVDVQHGEHGIPVFTKALDQLDFKGHVCLIKIDVEGHEVEVLMGARETIGVHKPRLVIEALDAVATGAVTGVMYTMNYRMEQCLDGRNWLYVAKTTGNGL
jgi:FkbM family methyltransferase